ISHSPGRCKARSCGVLSRARSLRLRTLPASLPERLFAAGEHELRRRWALMDRVRDAMVPEPRTLSGDSPAQEAGELLSRPEVRAVFVAEDERLAGVITRGTLVRDVVAAGRDAATTRVGEIAEPPRYTLDPELPLDEAFQFLEDHDLA